jgi:predicted PurR-regulated permease PerM
VTPIDARTSRTLFTALLFAMALGFLYYVRHTLMAFLFAVFFAYLMDPAVSRLQRVLKGRGRAVLVIYVVLLVLVGWLFFSAGPRILHQAARLGNTVPALLENLGSGQIAEDIGAQRGWSFATRKMVKTMLVNHREEIMQVAQTVGVHMAEVAQRAWLLVLVPILSIFFLRDGRVFSEVLLKMVRSAPQREFVQGVIDDLNQMLAHFIRAQLMLAALSWLVYSSVLAISGVPYAMTLGTAGGALEFIPVVGPLVAAALILGFSVLLGYPHWIWLIAFLGMWRLAQDYFFTPKIMGDRMRLHPLAAIFGVLAGGEMAGVLGVYLSIPVMASLRIVWHRWQLYAEKRTFGPLNDYALGAGFAPRQ